jgi:hypothetical protein
MQQEVNLIKEVYGRNTYTKVIDTSFTELYKPPAPSETPDQISVEQFFDYYDQLFFQISVTGEVNSHEYLVRRSTDYIGGAVLSDNEKAYIDEINSLRQQLLEANQNFMSLNNII